jgi:hypothetical protein
MVIASHGADINMSMIVTSAAARNFEKIRLPVEKTRRTSTSGS